jgi:uncharacterized protein
VPPPMVQGSADCARPTYASDQRVCSDPDLKRLDGDLVSLLAAGPEPAGPWIEPQVDWFRRSRSYAFSASHADCRRTAYFERIGLLRATSRPPAMDLACRPAQLAGALQPEGLVLRNGDRLLGIAARAIADWQPFLELRADRRDYRVHDRQGRLVARCARPR